MEFIVEQRENGAMNFFFMEMNTRLQVEHPVTEAITGLDLVEWQLRVASGEALPLSQADLRITGHAIEARICAENPDRNFLPATGELQDYKKPPHVSFSRGPVRFDDGVREGDRISPYYDSMVAKLIVHGSTREEALARLDDALAQTHIVGLQTNVQFLRHVVKSPSFTEARLDTALIPREQAVLFDQEPVGLALTAGAVIARALEDERRAAGTDPFSRRDGWNSHGLRLRRFPLSFHGESAEAELRYLHDGALSLTVNGVGGPLQWSRAAGDALDVRFNGQRCTATVYRHGEDTHVFTPQGATRVLLIDAFAHAGEAAADTGRLTAPMPGKLLSFAVKAGDSVTRGQALAVLEAMKMEHTIAAPADGVVQELMYAPGDQVAEGAELLKLNAAG